MLQQLENMLLSKRNCIYFIGKKPTLVDYIIYSHLSDLEIYDLDLVQGYDRLNTWYKFCRALPGIEEVHDLFDQGIDEARHELGIPDPEFKHCISLTNKFLKESSV